MISEANIKTTRWSNQLIINSIFFPPNLYWSSILISKRSKWYWVLGGEAEYALYKRIGMHREWTVIGPIYSIIGARNIWRDIHGSCTNFLSECDSNGHKVECIIIKYASIYVQCEEGFELSFGKWDISHKYKMLVDNFRAFVGSIGYSPLE